MNSEYFPNSYANSPELKYGLQYAILVSPKVTYENPKAKFTLPYVTPNIKVDDEQERLIAKNKSTNVLNQDQLGLTSIVESNCIILTVPRHLFYIENSFIVTNKTPCTCNLAHGAGDAADYAASEASQTISDSARNAIEAGLGVVSSIGNPTINSMAQTAKQIMMMASTVSMMNAKLGSTSAAKNGGAISGQETLAKTEKSSAKVQDDLVKEGQDPEFELDETVFNDISKPEEEQTPKENTPNGNKEEPPTETKKENKNNDVDKAVKILSQAASKLPDIISNASNIGRSSGLAGAIETIQAGLNAALDAMSIVDVIGVPGQQTIDAIKLAGTILGYAKGLASANSAGAASAGISILEATGMVEDKKVLGLLQQAGEIYQDVANMDGNIDYSQIASTVEDVIDFNDKLKDSTTKSNPETPPTNETKKQEQNTKDTSEKSAEKQAEDDQSTIDQALTIAKTASSFVEDSSKINKYISALSSAVQIAQNISKKGVQAAELVSAAGGTAAEVAGALGDAKLAQMALNIGSKIENVMKCVDILSKENVTIADIAEAAFIAASSAAGSSVSSSIKQGVQSGLDIVKKITDKIKKSAGSDYDVTSSQISDAAESIEQEGPYVSIATQMAMDYIDDHKDELEKEELVSNATNVFMEEIAGLIPGMEIPNISVDVSQTLYKLCTHQGNFTSEEMISLAETFITPEKISEWCPGVEPKHIETIKTLANAALKGTIKSKTAEEEGKSPVEVGTIGGKAVGDAIEESKEDNQATPTPGTESGIPNPGFGGNTDPTEEQIEAAIYECQTCSTVASINAGDAGGSEQQITDAAGKTAEAELERDSRTAFSEKDKKEIKGKSVAPTVGALVVAEKTARKEMNTIMEPVSKKAQETAQKQMELGKKNTAYCGVGTCSPKVINVRRTYEKGQKFIVANIGGNIDSPVIIGVVD